MRSVRSIDGFTLPSNVLFSGKNPERQSFHLEINKYLREAAYLT